MQFNSFRQWTLLVPALITTLWAGASSGAAQSNPIDLEKSLAAVAQYEIGQSRAAMIELEERLRNIPADDPFRARLEAGLAQLLSSDSTYEGKRYACRLLWILGSERSIPALESLLADPATTHIACYALSQHPSPSADLALRRQMTLLAGEAQVAVVTLVGDRRIARAIEPLHALASGDRPLVRDAAIAALGRIGTPEACDALAALLSGADPAQQRLVELALLQGADRLRDQSLEDNAATLFKRLSQSPRPMVRRAALLGLFELHPEQRLSLVLSSIKSGSAEERATAISLIPQIEGAEATRRFVQQLKEAPTDVKTLLVDALGRRGDPATLPAMAELLRSGSPELAEATARAISQIGDPSSVLILLDAISARPGATAGAAVQGLRQMEGAGVDAALVRALQEADSRLQPILMGIIAERGIADAASHVLAHLESSDPVVVRAAYSALGRLAAPELLPSVLKALARLPDGPAAPEAEQAVVQILNRLESLEDRLDHLLAAYAGAESANARRRFLGILAAADAPASLGVLLGALYDRDPSVVETALRVLSSSSDRAAAEPLMVLAKNASSRAHRVLALRGYLRLLSQAQDMPPERQIAGFKTALDLAERDEEKKLALAGLASSTIPGSLKIVEPLLQEPSLRSEAHLAVVAIAQKSFDQDRARAERLLRQVAKDADNPQVRDQAQSILQRINRTPSP